MPIASPSMRPSSPSVTWVPNEASWPFNVTRPASIHLSASRREQTPVSLMYLLSRTGVALRSAAQKRADLLRQDLGGCGEQVIGVIGDIDKLAVRQRGFELRDVDRRFKACTHDQRRLLDRRKPVGDGYSRQNQAPHESRSRRRQVQRSARAAVDAQQIDLTQP